MSTIEERASREVERLNDLLFDCKISDKKRDVLHGVIENVAWMKVKLEDTREKIKHLDVAIPYDNGGGQTGIRENPLFKGYEQLWKSYMSGMGRILDLLPDEEIEPEQDEMKPKSVLELVVSKHRKEA